MRAKGTLRAPTRLRGISRNHLDTQLTQGTAASRLAHSHAKSERRSAIAWWRCRSPSTATKSLCSTTRWASLRSAPYNYPTLRILNVTDDGEEDDYAASARNSSRTILRTVAWFRVLFLPFNCAIRASLMSV